MLEVMKKRKRKRRGRLGPEKKAIKWEENQRPHEEKFPKEDTSQNFKCS